MQEKIGIDLGDTIFDRSVSPSIPFKDSFRVIKRLVDERFGAENVYIVSKVNDEQKLRALTRLAEYKFFETTGIPVGNLYFCPERRDKGSICKELGITHFVDDRVEVFHHLTDFVSHCYLFRGNLERQFDQDEMNYFHVLKRTVVITAWDQIEGLLLK